MRLSLPFVLALTPCLFAAGCAVEDAADQPWEVQDSEIASNASSVSVTPGFKSPAPQAPNLVGDWTGGLSLRRLGDDITLVVASQNGRNGQGVLELGPSAAAMLNEDAANLVFDVTLTAAANGDFHLAGTSNPSVRGIPPYSLTIDGAWDGPTSSPDFDGDLRVQPTNVRLPNPNGVRVPATNLIAPIAMEKG